jgi:hypothetical protein
MRITDEQIRHLEKPRPTLLELMRQVERRRNPKPLELAAYLLACIAISGIGLIALPFVITALGAVAPFAAIGLFLHWAWRARRCSR